MVLLLICSPARHSRMQDQGHHQPTECPCETVRNDLSPADMVTALTACLGELSVGCISPPCMLCCADHKCTPLPGDSVHIIKLTLSKAAGLWNVEKEGSSEWGEGEAAVKMMQLYRLDYENVR